MYTMPGNTIESIVYVRDDAKVFTSIPVPQSSFLNRPQYGARLRETTGGLWIDYHGKEFQYLVAGQTAWKSRSKPQTNCVLNEPEVATFKLITKCDGELYQSSDGGESWMKIARDGK